MKHLIVFTLLLVAGICRSETPSYFLEESFTCATFAEAVNHFVGIGEDAAIRELNGLESSGAENFTNGFDRNARILIMCRVLFEPRGNEPIAPPDYGWLGSLGSMGFPVPSGSWTNISKYWPLFPVARSGSTYFVLSEGYSYQGFHQETPHQYIANCKEAGTFRKNPVKVPTREDAKKDATALRKSESWRAIKWKDSDTGYSFDFGDDEGAWSFIQQQADSIKIP